ncbi:MAG: gluconate 2-dehydrogenase subunit 3 family protein [Cyclobacteriaceae bacterium]
MNRREVLQKTALVLGYAVTGPALVGIMNGCKATPELNYKPQFFTEEQAAIISELAEIIMPKTDTPGAKDVGVPAFIDSMLFEVYSKEKQQKFLKGLEEFDEGAKKTFGENFVECKPEEKVAHVKKHHDAALSTSDKKSSWGWWSAAGDDKPFILKIKELTLLGFFTSEPGSTQVLQYNQVPGPFKGCVPLKEVGKTWAT